MRIIPHALIVEDPTFRRLAEMEAPSAGVEIARVLAERLLHEHTKPEELPEPLRRSERLIRYLTPSHSESETRIYRLSVRCSTEVLIEYDGTQINVTIRIGGAWTNRRCVNPEYSFGIALGPEDGRVKWMMNDLGIVTIQQIELLRATAAPA